jgi:archaellin
MNPELSRRAARALNSRVALDLSFDDRKLFAAAVAKADEFESLPLPFQELILGAEIGTKGLKHLPGRHNQQRHAGARGINGQANNLMINAKKDEPEITGSLMEVAGDHGGEIVGLEFRFKSEESLKRKMTQKFKENTEAGPADVAASINDSLRYTVLFDEDNYVNGSLAVMKSLKVKGYEFTAVKNYWKMGEGDYKGVNTTFKTKSGTKVELQFHTKKSLDTKQNVNHRVYEKFRVETSPKLRAQYMQEMQNNWMDVNMPEHVGAIALGEI